ncbi:sodium-coupled neutral amino acid transporter 9-like [Haliotis rufescens]|uniref:sodium-coupled neutral amino acid transporter 9-like n=1 Tax=Haliotis rufescens TaxID=6454 RepID=UPI00201E9F75|nr:sodium-coupled neutral amino acid transporter 9-like [Haliotis rufescens]
MDDTVGGGYGSINSDIIPINGAEDGNSRGRTKMGRGSRRDGEVATARRQPIRQYSIGSTTDDGDETQALLSRYKYYNRLAPHSESVLQMPEHVVPENYWIKILIPTKGKQSSIITIFSLWNTMMGTSILAMPWAIKQAGFVTGIVLLAAMAALMLYTSYRILKSGEGIAGSSQTFEFSDVCGYYLGRWAEIGAVICSLLTLLGGAIVYWILMSNFLYNVVTFIYYKFDHADNSTVPLDNSTDFPDTVCSGSDKGNNSVGTGVSDEVTHDTFTTYWHEQHTVPFFLIVILGPLLNFKSPTFFTKFNSLGTISVAYLVCFVAVKASHWKFNIDFNPSDALSWDYVENFKLTFPALTGIASLAYFVQNCCLAICRNQKHPENNVRDLTIAYILVAATYIYMGAIFYASFPLDKSCIEDNLLNNINTNDVMAFVARIGLFFQMLTVFPLLLFIFRIQFMQAIFKSVWPSWRHVMMLNLVLMSICILFAVFEPHIGRIIGFVGAFCGFSYAIALPCLVHMRALYLGQTGSTLSWPSAIFHSALILLGFANFVGQFLIIGHTS